MLLHPNAPYVLLASQSPRRAELLQQLGIQHQPLLAWLDENVESLEAILGQESPAVYVQRVMRLKLQAAIERAISRDLWHVSETSLGQAAPILCADTTVALGRTILGKPAHETAARQMLSALSGKRHRVLTAVGIAWRQEGITHQAFALSCSYVTFAALSEYEIATYVATGEPFGKAGAYAIQGQAAAFIRHLSGSYSGVMGLPLHETTVLLKQAGVL